MICPWCEQAFEPRAGQTGSPRRFCAETCRVAFHRGARLWGIREFEAGRATVGQFREAAAGGVYACASGALASPGTPGPTEPPSAPASPWQGPPPPPCPVSAAPSRPRGPCGAALAACPYRPRPEPSWPAYWPGWGFRALTKNTGGEHGIGGKGSDGDQGEGDQDRAASQHRRDGRARRRHPSPPGRCRGQARSGGAARGRHLPHSGAEADRDGPDPRAGRDGGQGL